MATDAGWDSGTDGGAIDVDAGGGTDGGATHVDAGGGSDGGATHVDAGAGSDGGATDVDAGAGSDGGTPMDAGPDAGSDGGATDVDAGGGSDGGAIDGGATDVDAGGDSDGGSTPVAPVLLTDANAYAVTTDGTYVYWTEFVPGAVSRIPVDAPPGTEPTVLVADLYRPYDIVSDATSIYWSDRFDIKKLPLGAPAGTTPTVIVPNFFVDGAQSAPSALDTDGVNIYWTDVGNARGGYQAPVGGGAYVRLSDHNIFGVAVGGGSVFLLNRDQLVVQRIPIGGGTTEDLGGWASPGIASDGSHVYWHHPVYPARLSKLAVDAAAGTTPTALAPDTAHSAILSVTTDGQNVYWIDANDLAVYQMSVGGGARHTLGQTSFLLSDSTSPRRITTDGIHVYWADGDGVHKVPAIDGACTGSTPMCFRP